MELDGMPIPADVGQPPRDDDPVTLSWRTATHLHAMGAALMAVWEGSLDFNDAIAFMMSVGYSPESCLEALEAVHATLDFDDVTDGQE